MNDKILNRLFKKVENVVFDMMTQKIGVLKNGSIFILEHDIEDNTYSLSENLFGDEFNTSIPAFAQHVPLSSVKEQDLVLSQKGEVFGWVVKVMPKTLKVLKLDGTISTVSPSKVGLLGGTNEQTIMVVQNMFGSQNGANTSGMNNMAQMMMIQSMLGDDKDSVFSSKNSDNSMMKMMMLQSMMGNNGSNQDNQNGMMNNNMMQMLMMSKLLK